jgi:hypothetical protein
MLTHNGRRFQYAIADIKTPPKKFLDGVRVFSAKVVGATVFSSNAATFSAENSQRRILQTIIPSPS